MQRARLQLLRRDEIALFLSTLFHSTGDLVENLELFATHWKIIFPTTTFFVFLRISFSAFKRASSISNTISWAYLLIDRVELVLMSVFLKCCTCTCDYSGLLWKCQPTPHHAHQPHYNYRTRALRLFPPRHSGEPKDLTRCGWSALIF